jgi:hypothetical protein
MFKAPPIPPVLQCRSIDVSIKIKATGAPDAQRRAECLQALADACTQTETYELLETLAKKQGIEQKLLSNKLLLKML